MKCVVVGGGLSGMLVAWELRAHGAAVTLLERGALGQEASWAGGGILSPLYPWRYPEPVTRLAFWAQAHYREAAEALLTDTGIDPEWTRSGLLILDLDESEQALGWGRAHGVPLEVLDAGAVRAVEPALGGEPAGGIWLPEIAQIRNPRLVKALRGMLKRLGVDLREQAEAQRLRVSDGVAVGVETGTGPVSGDAVVVAGGAWSAGLLGELPHTPAVEPVRGQMILFRGRPELVRRIVLSGGHYVIPRRDGRILAGSTLEYVGFDKSTTPEARRTLWEAAVAIIPGLEALEVEHHWAGLRPGSPDGVPYVGEHPAVKGLFVNAGHFRNGVVLGLAAARLLSDLILRREPILDPRDYALTAPRSAGPEARP
jgi:glycine oxidase